MNTIYIVFIVLAIVAECTSLVDTKNIIKKIALFIILVGLIGDMSGHMSNFVKYGAFVYILTDLWRKRGIFKWQEK